MFSLMQEFLFFIFVDFIFILLINPMLFAKALGASEFFSFYKIIKKKK
jgi:hypothetical protein